MKLNKQFTPPENVERDCPQCDNSIVTPATKCSICGISVVAITRGGDAGWAWESEDLGDESNSPSNFQQEMEEAERFGL